MTPQESKAQLRASVRTVLREIPPALRVSCSLAVCERIRQHPGWQEAASVLFYSPLPDEIDISPLLQECIHLGKTAALPKFSSDLGGYVVCQILPEALPLGAGKFGILEPSEKCPVTPLNQLDFLLVPGVAFDMKGRRLGRGKGFYDRLLAQARGTKCGIAFDEQIQQELPSEPHDIMVNCLVTPTRWLAFSQRAALQ